MIHDHAVNAWGPDKTALQQWLYGAEPGNLPDVKSRPEAAGDFHPVHHDHCGRNVNRPGSNAVDHHDASRERYPDLQKRDCRLPHISKRSVHGKRRRRNSSGCRVRVSCAALRTHRRTVAQWSTTLARRATLSTCLQPSISPMRR